VLSRIQSALRETISGDAPRVGPFLIRFDAVSDHPYRNYAIPDDGAKPTAADVADLVAAFVRRGRKPRLEYLSPAPAVDAALEAAGFTVDTRLPLMTVTLEKLRIPDAPTDVDVVQATSDEDLRATAAVQNMAFDAIATVSRADIARLRRTDTDGGLVVLARCAGKPCGAGMFLPPRDDLAQIAGVAVLPGYRHRGIASTVSAELTRRAYAAGVTPYLETEAHNERRLYGPLGYTTIGEMIAISLPR
jgi:ribosomal protein S18 acetylase RimI-like enzyme